MAYAYVRVYSMLQYIEDVKQWVLWYLNIVMYIIWCILSHVKVASGKIWKRLQTMYIYWGRDASQSP